MSEMEERKKMVVRIAGLSQSLGHAVMASPPNPLTPHSPGETQPGEFEGLEDFGGGWSP